MNQKVIECIPSATMREYLRANPIKMSVMQQATIVFEYVEGKKRISLFQSLLEETNNEVERKLLSYAIKDFQGGNDWISDVTQEIYHKNFLNEKSPAYPFSEICGLPILFKEGDVIRYSGRGSMLYYVGGLPVLIPGRCDFSDECYLCYTLREYVKTEKDLGLNHEHIPLCEAERVLIELAPKQKNIYRRIEMLLYGTQKGK